MKKEHIRMIDAANNASATARGAANVLLAFSSSGQEVDVDTTGLLCDALQGAADAMDGVAESIRREDGGEER